MPLNPAWSTGIDISVHNGHYNYAAKPVDYIILRASNGTARDSLFEAHYQESLPANVPIMAYHYMRTTVPWKVQADNYLAAVVGKKISMLWWDYEPGDNTLDNASAANAVSAMSYLRQQTAKPVGLYADRQRTSDIYRAAPGSRDFPLWLAQYRTSKFVWDTTPNIQPILLPQFPNGLAWMVWQYASEKNWLGHDAGHEYGVESFSIDINTCKQTRAELISYLSLFEGNSGIFDTPPSEPTVEQRLDKLEDDMRLVKQKIGL